MSQRPFTLILLAAVLLVVGDAILQISAVGSLPANTSQWHDLLRPEIINALVFVVVLGMAKLMKRSSLVLGLMVASFMSTGIHRWIAGPSFTLLAIGMHIVLYFVVGWVSLWLAGMLVSKPSSSQ